MQEREIQPLPQGRAREGVGNSGLIAFYPSCHQLGPQHHIGMRAT